MRTLETLVRPNVMTLSPYSSARSEYSQTEGVFLDANENPYGDLNRYPDPLQKQLRQSVSLVKGVPHDQIFVGNGSDEIIDLCYRVFCRPCIDKAITFQPTYGMYQVAADVNEVQLINLPLDDRFQIIPDRLVPFLEDETIKLLLLCSPNNPTGNLLHGIEDILRTFTGIVIVDEAYIDFSEAESWITKLHDFPNLIVVQTLSKAYGLAAARIGMAFTHPDIVALLDRIKPPYNISGLNQIAAVDALQQVSEIRQQTLLLIAERKRLELVLSRNSLVKKIYPSDANFLLVLVDDADGLYLSFLQHGVIVRNRHSVVSNCIRITVGTHEENDKLINALTLISNSN